MVQFLLHPGSSVYNMYCYILMATIASCSSYEQKESSKYGIKNL